MHCHCVSLVGNMCERDNCSVAFVKSTGTDNVASLILVDPGIAYFADDMPRAKGYAM